MAVGMNTLLGTSKGNRHKVEKVLASAVDGIIDSEAADLGESLAMSNYVVGTSLTVADLLFFAAVHPQFTAMDAGAMRENPNLTRWFDLVQHDPALFQADSVPVVDIDVATEIPPLPVKVVGGGPGDGKKGGKKGKKGKKGGNGGGNNKKGGDAPGSEHPFSKVELRVGRILECEKHPEADKLYLEKIDVGEDEPRTVISGLVDFIPLDQMIGATVVAVCNLKPSKLVGIMSHAMVLCASNEDHTAVELVTPPPEAAPGERIVVEGLEIGPHVKVIKKSKFFRAATADMAISDDLFATYKGAKMITETSGLPLVVKSLAGATNLS